MNNKYLFEKLEQAHGVTVEQLVKKLMKEYGFNQILRDHDLTVSEVVQVLYDHGYIDLERYEDNE